MKVMPSGSSISCTARPARAPKMASGSGSGVTNQYCVPSIPIAQPCRAVMIASS